jgi:hypothetical protein
LAKLELRCRARSWRELAAFIQDALFEAQHSEAGLHGASPSLVVLLSGALLPIEGPQARNEMRNLSARWQSQGVPHSIHRVPCDRDQPAWHLVHIFVASRGSVALA